MDLLRKEEIMNDLLCYDYEECPRYVLDTFEFTQEQREYIEKYLSIVESDEGDDYLDTEEQINAWTKIESWIGVNKEDWDDFSYHANCLTKVRVKELMPKFYEERNEQGKQDLAEIYELLVLVKEQLLRSQFKKLKDFSNEYSDVFYEIMKDIIEKDN